MVAVDTNILVYAHRADSEFHKPSATLIRKLAEGTAPWALPWPCVHEFIGVVTNRKIFPTPSPMMAALHDMDVWMESPSLRLIGEGADYWPGLKSILALGKVTGAKIHDARVAAICRAHGISSLYSADRDFRDFPVIRIINPLTV